MTLSRMEWHDCEC